MINFHYVRANDVADAVRQVAADPAAKFIAGGTNLIDLMKEDVERPSRLIVTGAKPRAWAHIGHFCRQGSPGWVRASERCCASRLTPVSRICHTAAGIDR